jgi:hypothetical protein
MRLWLRVVQISRKSVVFMTTDDEPQSPDFFLGKLSAQVKELIHQISDLSQKVEGIGWQVLKSSSVPEDIKGLKEAVSKLEASENRREGATNTVRWLISSPLIPWLALAVVVGWIVLEGRI